jgi:NAD(P)-dependent dehydrogenase (short-subunit alcohol dehydrogenase family)
MAFPGLGSYASSKFALEGWTEALRFEMKPLGVHVVLVEPGSFETDIWHRNARAAAALLDPAPPHAARASRWRNKFESQVRRADPQIVANLIARILVHPRPRLRYLIGKDARLGVLLRRLLPARLFEKIVLKVSGMDR